MDEEPAEPITYKIIDTNRNGLFQQPQLLQNISEIEGYITKEKAKDVIVYKRKRFEISLIERNGPPIIPTIFKNNEGRFDFVRQMMKEFKHLKSPGNPPELPFYWTSFADDVFMNLHYNFSDSVHAYIGHGQHSKLIFLRDSACGELALEEMLMRQPHFYSNDWKTLKLSSYVDLDRSKWISHSCNGCPNPNLGDMGQFVADFSMILPEEEVSTVMVSCNFCGWLAETILSDNTVKAVKNDIEHNIAQNEFDKMKTNEDVRYVMRLPLRSCDVESCSFVEGLMGVTSLGSKKHPHSILVRTRIYYTCPPTAFANSVLHNPTEQNHFYSSEFTEMMSKFGL